MGTGATGHVGLAKETTWGTGVAPTVWPLGTEDLNADFPEIEVDVPSGSRNAPRSDRGRPSFAGSISGILAKPNSLGHILQAALIAPTTTGAGPNYFHTFVPRQAPVSSDVALVPYSVQSTRGDKTTRFNGCQLNELTLNAPVDGRLTVDTSWMAKGWTPRGLSAATPVLETGRTFMFRHAAHQKGSTPAAFNDIKNLTLSYTNNLEGDMAQDGTEEMRAMYLGTSRLTVDMTLVFANTDVFDNFVDEEDDQYIFRWEIDANTYLQITIPNLSVKSYSDPLSGRGILEASVTAAAEDAGSGLFEVELGNTTDAY
ncbi:MAG: phage tail tube protein [Deinococcota bacterium]